MDLKNATIIQDMKIFQQLISSLPQTGNQFFFIMAQNVNGESRGKGEFDLLEYIESLPQPRLKSLNDRVAHLALERFQTSEVAGRWLGGSRRIIEYRLKKGEQEEA